MGQGDGLAPLGEAALAVLALVGTKRRFARRQRAEGPGDHADRLVGVEIAH